MSKEMVSNKALVLVLVFAIVVSVASTFMGLYKVAEKFSVPTIVTGRASSDLGYINLSIADSLNIDVDNVFNVLNYDACTPNATGIFVDLGNNLIEGVPGGNCTGDNGTRQYIVINNIGNVDANVTVQAECNDTTFIGSTTAQLNLTSVGCLGGAEEIVLLEDLTEYYICSNVTRAGGAQESFNVTTTAWIPNDAVGAGANCGGDSQNELTFSARKI